MKLFTINEANILLPEIIPKLRAIQKTYARIAELKADSRAAATVSEFGGGMKGGTDYVKNLYQAGKLTTEINDLGVQLKDYSRGLIDFPCFRDGRVVLLCWQFEDVVEEIKWWHEVKGGFAGRRPI